MLCVYTVVPYWFYIGIVFSQFTVTQIPSPALDIMRIDYLNGYGVTLTIPPRQTLWSEGVFLSTIYMSFCLHACMHLMHGQKLSLLCYLQIREFRKHASKCASTKCQCFIEMVQMTISRIL